MTKRWFFGMIFQERGGNEYSDTRLQNCNNFSIVSLIIFGLDKGLSQWVAWCEEKMIKFGEDASKKLDEHAKVIPVQDTPSKPEPSEKKNSEPSEPKAPSSSSEQCLNQPATDIMPTPKIKVKSLL